MVCSICLIVALLVNGMLKQPPSEPEFADLWKKPPWDTVAFMWKGLWSALLRPQDEGEWIACGIWDGLLLSGVSACVTLLFVGFNASFGWPDFRRLRNKAGAKYLVMFALQSASTMLAIVTLLFSALFFLTAILSGIVIILSPIISSFLS